MSRRILVVDDDPAMCDVMRDELVQRGLDVTALLRADEAFLRVTDDGCDVVVTDVKMRGMNGIDLCRRIVDNRPDIPVIVVTAFGSIETAIATLRAGAFDFLMKPFSMDELAVVVERALHHRQLRDQVKRLGEDVARPLPLGELLGKSDAMRQVGAMIARIADGDPTVLITGETGTGKELAARAIHRRGRRADAKLVTINCAALPETLLESELFGHVRGAFTDARSDRRGLLAEADGGTLFLDEVGEMPLSMQAKLLRALETRSARPVGGSTEVPFDVRLITATNRDLPSLIEAGDFREDLYYRINVVQLELPPLRHRGGDVLLLAQTFLAQFGRQYQKAVSRLSSAAAERLLNYAWPGNVRELRNGIERAVALAQYEELLVEDLPPQIRDYRSSHVLVAADDPTELVSLAAVERRYIERVLDAVHGNKRQAARILGLDRVTLYRRLERYGLLPKK